MFQTARVCFVGCFGLLAGCFWLVRLSWDCLGLLGLAWACLGLRGSTGAAWVASGCVVLGLFRVAWGCVVRACKCSAGLVWVWHWFWVVWGCGRGPVARGVFATTHLQRICYTFTTDLRQIYYKSTTHLHTSTMNLLLSRCFRRRSVVGIVMLAC